MQLRYLFLIALLVTGCASVRNTTPHRSHNSEITFNQRKTIVDYAMTLVGTRYKYGGTSPRSGFDCSGFTSYVLGKYGYALPRTSSGQSSCGRVVKPCDAQPGDLVFFGRGGRVDHVAIVVRSNKRCMEIVHSSSSGGVLVEDVMHSGYWKKRVLFAVDIASL